MALPAAVPLDATQAEDFERLLAGWQARVVVHLAVSGKVVVARKQLSTHCADTIDAAVNVLEVLNPKVFIFSSSCAVYGETRGAGVRPSQKGYRPRSVYALSKIAVELICTQWATANRRAAVVFRFGNVVGRGCGGLVRYLTRHALKYPEGERPVRLRGAGRIVRDYVPIDYVSQVLSAATERCWKPGSTTFLNVGTGRGITNAAVADRVRDVLKSVGYQLRIEWDQEPALGETTASVLEVSRTERLFGIPTALPQAVWDAIEEAVRGHLEDAGTDEAATKPQACVASS